MPALHGRLLCHRQMAAGVPPLVHKCSIRLDMRQLEAEFARSLSGFPYGDEPGVLQQSRLGRRNASFGKKGNNLDA